MKDTQQRVLRGGSFITNARFARSAYRTTYRPVARLANNGFRVARTYSLSSLPPYASEPPTAASARQNRKWPTDR